MSEKILEWAKELQNLSQSALAYCKDEFNIERFERIRSISVEMMSALTDIKIEKMKDIFAGDEGYQTPKVDIRASIINDDKILLVKEKNDGKWSMPGGWADTGHTVFENIIKESKEEAGIDVKPKQVLAILDRHAAAKDNYPFTVYKIFVSCDYVSGDFIENIETSDSRFFPIDDLPELSSTRSNQDQIELCFKAHKDPNHKTVCD